MTHSKIFTVEHHKAADGFVYTVVSPSGTSVDRFEHYDEAYDEAVSRNAKTRADSGHEPPVNIVGSVVAYEEGELTLHETIEFFGYLIRSGLVANLQGQYQRTAASLVADDFLTEQGDVVLRGSKVGQ